MDLNLSQEMEGTILAIIGLVVYGVHPIVVKYGTSYMSPLSFSSVSALIASFLLLLFLFSKGGYDDFRNLNRFHWIRLAFVGIFSTGLAFIFFFEGTNLSTGINSGIILRTEVLFSIILSYIILKERITKKQLIFTFMVLIGLILILGRGFAFQPKIGDLLLLFTPICWQIGHVISKKVPLNPYSTALGRNFFGGILLLSFTFITNVNINLKLWIIGVEAIIIAVGHTIFYASIKRINLSKTTGLITPAPVITIIGSHLILGENVGWYHIIGYIFIFAGTIFLGRIKSERLEENNERRQEKEV